MNLSAEQLAAIDEELFAGNVIAAIRMHRGFTSAQLIDAKSFVDRRLDELRSSQPLRFPIPSTPPKPDPQILQQIAPLSDRDLRDLRSTLKQTNRLLYGLNYAPTLAVSAASLPSSDLPFLDLLVALYPHSTPYDATILPVSTDELVTDVTKCMKYAGDNSAGPQFTDRRLRELTNTLLPQYWRQLNALAPLESSMLYSYSSDVGLPGYYVFWFFAYLIHCLETNRCVVITGMASD